MKRFVIGDVHGGYKSLMQCMERSGINYEEDMLICLGDVADGWPQTPQCFDEFLKIKNFIMVMGNHDEWLFKYLKYGSRPSLWLQQGGKYTLGAYSKVIENGDYNVIDRHKEVLQNAHWYYEMDNMLFVHGGYNWHKPISETYGLDFTWDRHMWVTAFMWKKQNQPHTIGEYDKVFIGHTTTSIIQPDLTPVKASNVWNLDQGGGYEGKLTIMNIDTEEYWQSDIVSDLYPNVVGRNK